MYSSNQERTRKEKTIKAHNILLKVDERDISGHVIFHFRKGQGIVGHEIMEKNNWGSDSGDNRTIAFNEKI